MPASARSGEISVVDGLVDELFELVLGGDFPPGSRLPPERELAARLGVSRVSVRAAVRRLEQWGVVLARQGSGTLVLPRRAWNAGAVPCVLAWALERGDWDTLVPLIRDAIELRRGLAVSLTERAAERMRPGALATSRRLLAEAWDARHDPDEFVRRDVLVFASYLDAAGMFASLWLTNTLSEAYVAFLTAFQGIADVPDDYVEANTRVIDALERGDGALARERMIALLERVDARMVARLPAEARRRLGSTPEE